MKRRQKNPGAPVSATKSRPQRPAEAPASGPVGDAPPRPRVLPQLGLCVLSGVLIFMSFPFTTSPDSNWWPLAWFGLVPFLWALRGDITSKRAFWLGAVAGLVTNFGGFWWISEVVRDFGHMPGYIAWPVAAVNAFYQGLMFAIFAWFYVRFRPRSGPANVFAIAALFTFVEFLFPLIFPWYLGNGQYRFIAAIQIADITGVMGLTFTMVAVNAALLRVAEWRLAKAPLPRRQLLGVLGVTAAVLVYGVIRVGQVDATVAEADTLKLGLVEADIGIWEKEAKGMGRRDQALTLHKNLLVHQEMSRDLAQRGADLIVWPESSYFPLEDPFVKRQDRFALGLGADGALLAWRHHPERGFSWSVQSPHALADAGAARLVAAAAEREDAWVAVGEGGAAVHGDGHAVLPLKTGTTASLRGVDVVSMPGFRPHADDGEVSIWAVGDEGTIVTGHLDGLSPAPSPVTSRLNAVSMSNGREGVIVGDGGVVLAIRAAEAKRVEVGTSRDLYAVWALRGEAEAVAVGQGGALVLRDGDGAWRAEQAPFERTLRHVVGGPDGRGGLAVYAAGDGGAMLRRDGRRWVAETFPGTADITALALDARNVPLAADAKGGLFRRDAQAGWRRLDAPGLGVVRAIAPLPYVEVLPLPRDIRYVWQGQAPLPELTAFMADPTIEFGAVSSADMSAVQRGYTTPVLFGGITWERSTDPKNPRTKYNTAIMLDEVGRVVGTYDKVYLLAFGEYIPFGDLIPELYDMLPESGHFTAGTEVRAFQWGERRVGVMICYEDIMPKFTGKLADKDPNIIINVTNDAWFGRTSEPYLHLALSVFRAVENRLVLARATNTGVSAIIDPVGRLTAQTRLTDPETTLETVPLMRGETLYGRVGDLFSWALGLALLVYGVLVRRRERRAEPRREKA